MLVALQSCCGDENGANCLAGSGLFSELSDAFRQPRDLGGVEFIRFLGEFHFAEIHDAVATIEQKVDLNRLAAIFRLAPPPRIGIGQDTGDAKRGSDLREMPQAKPFEGQPPPCVYGGGPLRQCPKMPVSANAMLKKLKMKEDEWVYQLIYGIALHMGRHGEPSQKTAFAQLLNAFRRFATASAWKVRGDFRSGHARSAPPQSLDDGKVPRRTLEKRRKEPPVFLSHLIRHPEKQQVEVLRGT